MGWVAGTEISSRTETQPAAASVAPPRQGRTLHPGSCPSQARATAVGRTPIPGPVWGQPAGQSSTCYACLQPQRNFCYRLTATAGLISSTQSLSCSSKGGKAPGTGGIRSIVVPPGWRPGQDTLPPAGSAPEQQACRELHSGFLRRCLQRLTVPGQGKGAQTSPQGFNKGDSLH